MTDRFAQCELKRKPVKFELDYQDTRKRMAGSHTKVCAVIVSGSDLWRAAMLQEQCGMVGFATSEILPAG
jgi:hypothetical protein